MALAFLLPWVGIFSTVRGEGIGNLSREPGALYVENYFAKPIQLKVLKEAPIFSQLDGRRRIGTLLADQSVTLVAVTDRAYRVRGQAAHGGVSGWVGIAFLEEPFPDFRKSVKAFHQRQTTVDALIAQKQIALGMTPGEVIAALGKPAERSSSVTAAATKQSLSFVTYRKVPQRVARRDVYGRIFYSTIYAKIETGRRTVRFENGAAVAIDVSETDPRAGQPKIVPNPVIVFR